MASLGDVSLSGGITAKGAGTIVSAGSIQGEGSGVSILQFSNGAILSADSVSGVKSIQFLSGAVGDVGGLGLMQGQSLVVSGAGTSLGVSSLSNNGGQVSLSAGAQLNSTGYNAIGNLSVSGAGSQFIGEWLTDARSVSISDGGSLSVLGVDFSYGGQLTVSGPGSSLSSRHLTGSVDINISNGGSITAVETQNLGSLSISGGSSSYKSSSTTRIKDVFSLRDGASMSVQQLNLSGASSIQNAVLIANQIDNSGALEIRESSIAPRDKGGAFTNSGSLTGDFASEYQLNNFGHVSIEREDSMVFRRGGNYSIGYINVRGSMEFLEYFTNDGTIVLSGSLRANDLLTNQRTIEVSGTASIGGGDFYNNTSGSVAVLGQSRVNFLDDVVNDGTIAIALDSTAVFHGSYSGNGSITGTGTSVLLGDLRPGHSPGSQTFEGDVVFGDDFSYTVEIGGLTQGSEYDVIHVGGLLTLDGTLSISLLNGVSLKQGDTFEILTFGAIEGEFAAFQGLTFEGLSFETIWGANNLTLMVIPEPNAATLLLPGLAGVIAFGWRRRWKQS